VGASRVWDAGLAGGPKDPQGVGTDLPCQGRRSCAVGFIGAYRPLRRGSWEALDCFPWRSHRMHSAARRVSSQSQ
jgi:hypothetical protein